MRPETKRKIVDNISDRVSKICKSKLNVRNLFHAINEHATSLMNYYIGLVELEPCELTEIDNGIRRILRENRIHFRAGNKERLYLSRSELGRGLQNVNHKCEKILLNLFYFLDDRKYMCSRKAAILVTAIKRATNLGTIIGFLKSKYDLGIDEIVKVKVLIENQKVELLKAISEKCLHGQLFKALENPLVDVKESSAWLKSGNNSPQSEGLYCYLQDRNLFLARTGEPAITVMWNKRPLIISLHNVKGYYIMIIQRVKANLES